MASSPLLLLRRLTIHHPSPLLLHPCRHESTSGLLDRRRRAHDRMVRVDHAGEYGADRIYRGQHDVLSARGGDRKAAELVKHMWEQEKHHLATFEEYMTRYRARPTALLPVWHVAGYALGAGTALLGKEAAMACTVAVEASITEHYNDQIRELLEDDPEANKELIETITRQEF